MFGFRIKLKRIIVLSLLMALRPCIVTMFVTGYGEQISHLNLRFPMPSLYIRQLVTQKVHITVFLEKIVPSVNNDFKLLA
jgi:hypothetical protein